MGGHAVSGGEETYNPWTVVDLVFHHLSDHGLHPVLGASTGNPGKAAAELLRAFGITPVTEGNRQAAEQTKLDLAAIRAVFFEVSQVESP